MTNTSKVAIDKNTVTVYSCAMKNEKESYTTIRVFVRTARKLKALSGMSENTMSGILEDLVEKAFQEKVRKLAEELEKD